MSPAASLPQAPRTSLVESTIALFRTQIETGAWKIGERIPREPDLAEMLQVGRNTVREAIRVLSHAQILEVRQGDGTYVRASIDPAEVMRRVSRASLRDHFELRAILETEAARLAAMRRTDDDLQRLRRFLEARGDAPVAGDLADFADRDLAFHDAIVAAAHNSALAELYRYFSIAARQSTQTALAERTLPEPDVAAHTKIVEAIARQDPERAAKAARAIVAPIIAKLTELLGDLSVGGVSASPHRKRFASQ